MRTMRGVLAVLAGIAGLGAVAYAASPQSPNPGSAPKPERSQGAGSLPKPKITMHPEKLATSTNAKFSFTVRGGKPGGGRGARTRAHLREGRAGGLPEQRRNYSALTHDYKADTCPDGRI